MGLEPGDSQIRIPRTLCLRGFLFLIYRSSPPLVSIRLIFRMRKIYSSDHRQIVKGVQENRFESNSSSLYNREHDSTDLSWV